MQKNNLTNNTELFEVEELESRFEMGKWVQIDWVPCDCPPDDEIGE